MATGTLEAARSVLESACDDVTEAAPADAVDGVQPALVAWPAATEQVSEVMRAAAAHGMTVVARGSGTKMSWGRPPSRADLVVDLSRMDAVLEHAAGDLIVDTQAGVGLADLQVVVSGAGQRLSVDETVPGASIGGTIATSTSGPGRVAAGTVRDLLIGVTVVRADGVVAKAGGRVVKNVAGYDLGKLVTGSFGTLAVITQAVFRLHPLPAARRVVSVEVADPAQAQRLVQSAIHAQVVPAAVEIDWHAGGSGTLTVLIEGTGPGVDGRTATAVGLLGQGSTVAEELPADWTSYPWAGQDRATALKATFAISGLERFLRDADAAATELASGIGLRLKGSAGAGVLYGSVATDADAAAVAALVDRLRRTSTELGGALVVLDAAPEVKAAVDSWGPVNALDLMRQVKAEFDPEHRLAPGRFVGGI